MNYSALPAELPVDASDLDIGQDQSLTTAHVGLLSEIMGPAAVADVVALSFEQRMTFAVALADAYVETGNPEDHETRRVEADMLVDFFTGKTAAEIAEGGETDPITVELGLMEISGTIAEQMTPEDVEALMPSRDEYIQGPSEETVLEADEVLTDRRAYLTKVLAHRILSGPEEVALAKKIEAGDFSAKLELVEHNHRLVLDIAKNYPELGLLDRDDYFQEGIKGLIRAAEKFDYRRGYKFSTYATYWVRQSIARYIANQKSTIRKPVHVVERSELIRRAATAFGAENGGQEPTMVQLAAATGMSKGEVEATLHAFEHLDSLDRPTLEDGDGQLGDVVASSLPGTEETVIQKTQKELLNMALSKLAPEEATVLELKAGLGDDTPKSNKAVANITGISYKKISEIYQSALDKLPAIFEELGITAADLLDD